jgi:hypothetical protein
MIPFAFPIFLDKRPRSAQYRQRAHRLALIGFALTAVAGLAIKYLA